MSFLIYGSFTLHLNFKCKQITVLCEWILFLFFKYWEVNSVTWCLPGRCYALELYPPSQQSFNDVLKPFEFVYIWEQEKGFIMKSKIYRCCDQTGYDFLYMHAISHRALPLVCLNLSASLLVLLGPCSNLRCT